jgi:hypothetical protein
VTILASGEAIVFGSAFHVPTRVQIDRPNPGPYSQTAAPFHEWSEEKDPFPLAEVIAAWGLKPPASALAVAPVLNTPNAEEPTLDDDIPF